MQYKKITDNEGIDYSRNINASRFCDVCKICFFLNKILVMKITHAMGVIIY